MGYIYALSLYVVYTVYAIYIYMSYVAQTPPPLVFPPVVAFMEVYNKSQCQPREVLVEVLHEYPEEVEYIYIPSCVVLRRCAGCCSDEKMQCTPTSSHNITMEVSGVYGLTFPPWVEKRICWGGGGSLLKPPAPSLFVLGGVFV